MSDKKQDKTVGFKLGRLPVPAQGMVFHYYRTARTPQRDQLRQIKDLGIDVIHTEESPVAPGKYRSAPLPPAMAWNYIETGKNQYDWGFLDQLVEDCEGVGLKLLHDICLTPHLPEWVARENSDTEILYPTGEKVGAFIRPNFCFVDYPMRSFSLAHPACRAAAADFMGKVARRYAKSEAVVGYILVEELCLNYPHTWTWYGQDVSPAAQKGFAQYLEGKYRNVAAMNKACGASHSSFTAAAEDRSRFTWTGRPNMLWVDWVYYRSSYVARFFKDSADAIKRADPGAIIATTAVPYPSYWISHGVRLEDAPFFELAATQYYERKPDILPSCMRWNRRPHNSVGLSNLCDFATNDITVENLVRCWFASLGVGSKWNVLYAWHRFSNEDAVTGKRVPQDNLKGFLPYMAWVREHRDFLGGLDPAPSEIAVLNPVRSDAIFFWQQHDPRLLRRSHTKPQESCSNVHEFRSLLDGQSVPYDIVPEESLEDALNSGRYKLLFVGEFCLSAATASLIRRWVEKGGKLMLLQGAARFDEYGDPATWFDDLIRNFNWEAYRSRDYADWAKDTVFPLDATVALIEQANTIVLPFILKWAGVQRQLDFIDETKVDTPSSAGVIPPTSSPWGLRDNPLFGKIMVFPLRNSKGTPVYVLVRKGTETAPLEKVSVAWNGGRMRALIPPSSETVRIEPSHGRLLLPAWRDTLILMPE
jgi:hypothetical protein